MLRFCILAFCLFIGAVAAAEADQGSGTGVTGPGVTGQGMTGQWMMTNPAPTGRWITPNHDAVIQISPCGQDLCGQIVGIALKPGEPVPKDWRGDTQCGLTIIRTAPDPDGAGNMAWTGSVLDPRDGSVYHARISLDASHHLRLRGYIGLPVFGQTQTWAPYTGGTTAGCHLPGAE